MKLRLAIAIAFAASVSLSLPQLSFADDMPSPSQSGDASQTKVGKLDADTLIVFGSTRLTAPRDWSIKREPDLLTLDAPEGDTHIVVFEVNTTIASDAKAAFKSAWARYQPDAKLSPLVITDGPHTDGWQEYKALEYDTPPNEQAIVEAHARRNGTLWTVTIIDGKQQTISKRSAAVGLMMRTTRPKDYVNETFAGRKPNPLDAARIAQLNSFLQTSMKELGIPGLSYALIDHDKIVYEGGLGVRELGKPTPVDANTLFLAASNTKGMSTLLLSTLVDEGKLRWDQPVTEVYPSFKLGSPEVTSKVLMKHLVCACTGLPRQDFEWLLGSGSAPPETAFKLLSTEVPTSAFGDVFQYNNLMASAAGYIGGHLAHPDMELGKAYDLAMRERIFEPLGMQSTTFDFTRALQSNHASPHSYSIDGQLTVIDPEMKHNETVVPYRPAGGAWTSAHDLIRYVKLEADLGKLDDGKQLVSSDNLLMRRKPQVAIGENESYGMGLITKTEWGVPVISHGGSLFGYKSNIYLIPDAGIGAVLLTNSDQGGRLLHPMLRRLMEIVYDGKPEAADDVKRIAENSTAARKQERKLLTIPANPALAKNLATHYHCPELGELTVQHKKGSTIFNFTDWGSTMATRKNNDGTISFTTIDSALTGLEFVGGSKDGKRTLILRDGQHEYVYVEG